MSNEKEGEKPNGRKSKGSNRERNVSWVKRSLIESWKARRDGEVDVKEGAEKDERNEEKEEKEEESWGKRKGREARKKRAPERTNRKETVQETDTGGRMREHEGIERTTVKELGKITP